MWKPQSLPLKIPFVLKEEAWWIVPAKYQEYQIALNHQVLETNLSFSNYWFKMTKLPFLMYQRGNKTEISLSSDKHNTWIDKCPSFSHPSSCCAHLATLLPWVLYSSLTHLWRSHSLSFPTFYLRGSFTSSELLCHIWQNFLKDI